ncbi:putative defense protein 3 [Scomber scombrus]|uniref:Defense protein 3 n=1 Tax=Scomber scombrus TaxID=13677 RepID=A0AAV1PPG6_SCOSC
MEPLFLAFIMLQMLCFVSGYPSGAPTGACEDMMPRHAGVLPQPSPAPYTLFTNMGTFQPGEPITVTIIGPAYRGVLLEARTGISANALGSWKLPPPDTRFLEGHGSPATHSLLGQCEIQHFDQREKRSRSGYWCKRWIVC